MGYQYKGDIHMVRANSLADLLAQYDTIIKSTK